MKENTHRGEPAEQEDDVWAWVVIGLIFCGVTVALFGLLIWQATHNSL